MKFLFRCQFLVTLIEFRANVLSLHTLFLSTRYLHRSLCSISNQNSLQYLIFLSFQHFLKMYTYIGCFEDRNKRLLHDGPYTGRNNKMSTEICFNHCNSKQYDYFATEVGSILPKYLFFLQYSLL